MGTALNDVEWEIVEPDEVGTGDDLLDSLARLLIEIHETMTAQEEAAR